MSDEPDTQGLQAGPDEPSGSDRVSQSTQAEQLEQAQRRSRVKTVSIAILAAVIIALIAIWLFVWGPLAPKFDAIPDNTVPVTTLPNDATLTAPPTQPTGQPTSAAPQPTASTSATPAGDVVVALTRWNWSPELSMISVGGFLPEVVESGGTCTLIATKGSETKQAGAEALPDVQTTICVVDLVDETLSDGEWTLVMRYDGPSGSGESDPVRLTVSHA